MKAATMERRSVSASPSEVRWRGTPELGNRSGPVMVLRALHLKLSHFCDPSGCTSPSPLCQHRISDCQSYTRPVSFFQTLTSASPAFLIRCSKPRLQQSLSVSKVWRTYAWAETN